MSLFTPASAGYWSLAHHRLKFAARSLLLLSGADVLCAHCAEHVEFNPAFFADNAAGLQVDIAKFSQGNIVLPGSYRTDVHLNGQWIGRESLSFVAVKEPNR